MNIIKKIIFTGLSLLFSSTFNSAYSADGAEKNLDDAMNLSRTQPFHIDYLDLDLNQLQRLLPIDGDTIKDDSTTVTLFDDDPLQQENSSVSTGNEEDDNFDFYFSEEESDTKRNSDTLDLDQFLESSDSEEDFNQESFELLANSILTQDIGIILPDAADTAQPSAQPLEKARRKAPPKKMGRTKQEIEARNEAIRQLILQQKAQNPSAKLTYMEILESLQHQYPDLTFPQIRHFLEKNPSLRTSKNSQKKQIAPAADDESLSELSDFGGGQSAISAEKDSLVPNSSDAADTAQPSAQPLEKARRKAPPKKMGRTKQEIEARNEAIRQFILQHKEQNPSTKLTYAEILEGLQHQYPDLIFPQIWHFLENNPSLRTSKRPQEDKERIQERNEAIRQLILQQKAQNPSAKLTYMEILESLQPQYPDLTFPQIRHFLEKNPSLRTSKNSQKKQIAPAADDESLSELSDFGGGQSAISAEKDSLVPNSSDAADTAQPSAQPLEKARRKAPQKKMGRTKQEIEARNEAIRQLILQQKAQNPSTKLTYPKILEGLQDKYPDLTLKKIEGVLKKYPSLRTSKRSQDNEQRAIVDAAITLIAIGQQGLIPENATTSGKRQMKNHTLHQLKEPKLVNIYLWQHISLAQRGHCRVLLCELVHRF